MAEEVKNTAAEETKPEYKGDVWARFETGDVSDKSFEKDGRTFRNVRLYVKGEDGEGHMYSRPFNEKQILDATYIDKKTGETRKLHGQKAIPVYAGETTWTRSIQDPETKEYKTVSIKLTGEQVKEAAKAMLEERKAYRAEQKGEKAAAEAPAKDAAEKPAKENYSEWVNFVPNGMIHETKKEGRLSVGLNQPDGTVANIFVSEKQIKRGEKTSNIRVYNKADKEAVAGYKSYQAARSEEYKKSNLDAKIAAAGEQVKEAAADAPTPEKAKNGQEL